jgi:peptidoglycan hydrolase-like protein with peptidoglycan-binding domain
MNSGPTLHPGATGADVKRVQRILVMIKLLDFASIDGSYGAKTEAAVKSFQTGNGLTADGIVGSHTWSAFPADPNTPTLQSGASGSAVTALQQGLLKFDGPGTATDPGAADGQFGPKTKKAVQAYQQQHNLTADGIVGDKTWWVPAGGAGATLASLSGLTTV